MSILNSSANSRTSSLPASSTKSYRPRLISTTLRNCQMCVARGFKATACRKHLAASASSCKFVCAMPILSHAR
eukprot:7025843-Prorocentrum_lima.AAC.1